MCTDNTKSVSTPCSDCFAPGWWLTWFAVGTGPLPLAWLGALARALRGGLHDALHDLVGGIVRGIRRFVVHWRPQAQATCMEERRSQSDPSTHCTALPFLHVTRQGSDLSQSGLCESSKPPSVTLHWSGLAAEHLLRWSGRLDISRINQTDRRESHQQNKLNKIK